MAKINVIDADIFTCKEDIIVHQTNCQGVMGHGIAKQVKKKYPEVFNGYYHYCKTTIAPELLGTALICECNDGKYIANIFGQLNYGEGLQTDYDMLEKGLKEVKQFADEHNLTVAIPYKIGCGLANGDWSIVEQIIDKIFDPEKTNIYRLEMGEKY